MTKEFVIKGERGMVECLVGTLNNSYFEVVSSKNKRGNYSLIAAIESDEASMMDTSSENAIPARMLDMQTGLITSESVMACQLVELTPQQIAHFKLHCIIQTIASGVSEVQCLQLLTPIINF